MSLFVSKKAAQREAQTRTLAAAKQGRRIQHSSGYARLDYTVGRKFRVLWEVKPR